MSVTIHKLPIEIILVVQDLPPSSSISAKKRYLG